MLPRLSLTLLLLVGSAGMAGPAWSEESEPPPVIVACQVNGYSVAIFNRGDEALAAESEVFWYVPFVRMGGSHVLRGELSPGAFVYVPNVLGSNFLDSATPCESSLDGPSEP